MRALLHDPSAPNGLRLGDAPDPEPGPHDALVGVAFTSLNFGEVAYLGERQTPGGVPGWDAAGTVVASAADGSGPSTGARVATFGWSDAWAELRSVDTDELAVVPDPVQLAAAAALPVAGVTALRAFRRAGVGIGDRLLVSGASGGVGHFAVQLAVQSGVHVIALVGSPERAGRLADLGAAEVVTDLDGLAPVQAALDNVGGEVLSAIAGVLLPGGTAVGIGNASREPSTIDFEAIRVRGGAQLHTFAVGDGFGPDLALLLDLVAAGRIDVPIGWQGTWDDVDTAVDALLGRKVQGKAVLEVTPS